MERLTLQALLGAITFIIIWSVFSLLFGSTMWYQLVLGLAAGLAFGMGWYVFGRLLHNRQPNK